jgi:hydroxyethylthiazole kinase-like uncharacterized protein yjeF
MEILTAEQMQRVDRRAESDHGIPAEVLMDNAGREIAAAVLRHLRSGTEPRILVLCGKGNNGGDGITAARHLASLETKARVALLAPAEDLKGAAAWALRTARAEGLPIEEVTSDEEWSRLRRSLPEQDLILDALLGTGTRGAARGRILEAIQALNASGTRVLSIDIPSGLSGSSSEPPGPCVEAEATFALAALKIPHVFPPASRFAGRLEVLDIGIPAAAMEAEGSDLRWADADLVSRLIPARLRDAHKGRFGHVLVLAGSRGKAGAAVLMARACLRSGAGLVTVACPASAQPIVAGAVPEAMTEPLSETPSGEISPGCLERVSALLGERDVLAAGPGLGTGEGAAQVMTALAAEGLRPMVLDADALNVLAATGGSVHGGSGKAVLTPHPGEAGRLLGCAAGDVQADRLGSVRRLAAATSCTVILKGFRSLVCDPEGCVAVNPTGNPGMATGGMGDALAGIVAAWLAQGLGAYEAAVLSAHAHGLAGDIAAEELGEIALVAGDLIERLPAAWKRLAPESPRTAGS